MTEQVFCRSDLSQRLVAATCRSSSVDEATRRSDGVNYRRDVSHSVSRPLKVAVVVVVVVVVVVEHCFLQENSEFPWVFDTFRPILPTKATNYF